MEEHQTEEAFQKAVTPLMYHTSLRERGTFERKCRIPHLDLELRALATSLYGSPYNCTEHPIALIPLLNVVWVIRRQNVSVIEQHREGGAVSDLGIQNVFCN